MRKRNARIRFLLRPEEAADALGISRSRLYAMIAKGTIPSVKLGKSRRIPTAALRRWVEAQVTAAARKE